MMAKYKSMHIKIIALILACLFLVNDISWAVSLTSCPARATLAVQSIFKPILDRIGHNYETQLRIEFAAILAMILKNPSTPFQDINSELDKWISKTDINERIANLVANPRFENEEIVLDVSFGSKSDKRLFRVTAKCADIKSIQNGFVNIEIASLEYMLKGGHAKSDDDSQHTEANPTHRQSFRYDWAKYERFNAYNYQYGILDPADYPKIYKLLEQVLDKLWKASGIKENAPALYLAEQEAINAQFENDKPSLIIISLGMLELFRKYRGGGIYEEDIAFVIAHELSHWIQWHTRREAGSWKIIPALEYDADIKAVQLLDNAGYSTKEIAQFFRFVKQMRNDSYQKNLEIRQSNIARIRKIRNALERDKYDEILQDRLTGWILKGYLRFPSEPCSPNLRKAVFSAKTKAGLKKALIENKVELITFLRKAEKRFKSYFEHSEEIAGFEASWIPADLSRKFIVQYKKGKTYLVMRESGEAIVDTDIRRIEETIDGDKRFSADQKLAIKQKMRNLYKSLKGDIKIGRYFDMHPSDDDRMVRIMHYIATHYLKAYHTPINSVSADILKELEKETERRKDLNALRQQDYSTIMARVREMRDWQEAIFFLAKLYPEARTGELFTALLQDLDSRSDLGPDEKDMFRFQTYSLFKRKDLFSQLEIMKHPHDFIRRAAVFSGFIMADRSDDEYMEPDEFAVNRWKDTYISDVEHVIRSFLRTSDPAEYFNDLADRYLATRIQQTSFNGAGDPIDRLMEKALRAVMKKGAIDDEARKRIFEIMAHTIFTESSKKLFTTIVYNELCNNADLFAFLQRHDISTDVLRRGLEIVKQNYFAKDVKALGSTYKETLERIYLILPESIEEGEGNCSFWARAIYEKFKPREGIGTYTYQFVNFFVDLMKRKGIRREFYSNFLYSLPDATYLLRENSTELELIYDGTGKDNSKRVKEVVDIVPGLSHGDLVEFELEDGSHVRGMIPIIPSDFYKSGDDTGCTVFCLKSGYDMDSEGRVDVEGDKIVKIFIQRPAPTNYAQSYYEAIRADVIDNILDGNDNALNGISDRGAQVIFLLSHGIPLNVDALIAKFFERMNIEEVKRVYDIIRKHFSDNIIKSVGLDSFETPLYKLPDNTATHVRTFDQYLSNIAVYMICRVSAGSDWHSMRRELSLPFIGEIQSAANRNANASNLVEWRHAYDEILEPLSRIKLTEREYNDKGVLEREHDRQVEHYQFAKFETAFAAVSGISFAQTEWHTMVEAVVRILPKGVLRNHFLYHLYFTYILKPHLELKQDDEYHFDIIKKAIIQSNPVLREDLEKKYIYMARYFVKDEYIENINIHRTGNYVSSHRDFDNLSHEEQEQYDQTVSAFNNYEFSEIGERLAYIDLLAATLFDGELINIIKDGNASIIEKMDKIESLYPRPSNTRDQFLSNVLDAIQPEHHTILELERLANLMHGRDQKNRALLLCLEKRWLMEGEMSFAAELRLVKQYFPEKGLFRDDILRAIIQNRVATKEELEQIKPLYSFSYDTILEKEVAQRDIVKDRFAEIISGLDVDERMRVILWLTNLTAEKPNAIKKIELLTHSRLDYIKNHSNYEAIHYPDAGLSDRRLLLEELLLKGEDSIIIKGRADQLITRLWHGILDHYSIALDNSVSQKLLEIFTIVLHHLSDDPVRQFKILSTFILENEKQQKMKDFKTLSDDAKLAQLVKAVLGSIGLIGIKIAQHLSTSSIFGLSADFKDVLGELTERAEVADKEAIFTVLSTLNEGNVAIEGIMGKASIKTTFGLCDSEDVYKVKNLQAYYEARDDINHLLSILSECEEKCLVTRRQRIELVDETIRIVEEENNFELEHINTERFSENYNERQRRLSQDGFIYRILLGILKHQIKNPECYEVSFSHIKEVKDNMLIKEERIRGSSLNDYNGSDKEQIYKVIVYELARQLFEDGFYHADPHPGNIFIRERNGGKKEIVFIDMGGVNTISEDEKVALERMLLVRIIKEIPGMKYVPFAARILSNIANKLESQLSFRTCKFLDKISYLLLPPRHRVGKNISNSKKVTKVDSHRTTNMPQTDIKQATISRNAVRVIMRRNINDPNKIIHETHIQARLLNNSARTFLEHLDREMASMGDNAPNVEVAIDVSLLSKEDVVQNASTWAYLILSCTGLTHINFRFEMPNPSGDYTTPDAIKRTAKNIPDIAQVLSLIKHELKGKALASSIGFDADKFIQEHVNIARSQDSIRVLLWSKEWFEWMRDNNINLSSDEYPVALEGATEILGEGVALRNFEAALAIGLSQATLALAKKRDNQKSNVEQKEYPVVRQTITLRLAKLYKILRKDIILTEQTIDNMVDDSPTVRRNLAIALALPPIAHLAFEKLKEYHERIQLLLRAA